MHCHSTFCVHLWLCPAVPPTGKFGGGGSANIAVIGKIVMTSVFMSPICICEIPANDNCLYACSGRPFISCCSSCTCSRYHHHRVIVTVCIKQRERISESEVSWALCRYSGFSMVCYVCLLFVSDLCSVSLSYLSCRMIWSWGYSKTDRLLFSLVFLRVGLCRK